MKKNPILLVVCSCVLAVAAGCAAPGVPQPPSLRLPATVDNLSAMRKGERVVLTWSPPGETTDHQTMRWPTTTRICRVLNQFPTNVCGEVVHEIKSGELATMTPPGTRRPLVSFEDVLPPALIAPENRATYTVEVVNQRGRSAGLSNQVRVSLVATTAPPEDLRVTLDAAGPLLHWSVPAMPAASPGISYGLRVYRRAKGKKEFALVGELPGQVGRGEFRDHNFEWEQEYDYKIASVTVLAASGQTSGQAGGQAPTEVEGDDSAGVHLMVHDVFPPAVPSGLQAVFSSVGQKPFIDLTWAPDTESDLAGYIVYRRSGSSSFAVVSAGPVKAPAWRDNDVQLGKTYYYTVAAVDVRGNQSAQSAPAEETVPSEVR
jgi:hypothetical protein